MQSNKPWLLLLVLLPVCPLQLWSQDSDLVTTHLKLHTENLQLQQTKKDLTAVIKEMKKTERAESIQSEKLKEALKKSENTLKKQQSDAKASVDSANRLRTQIDRLYDTSKDVENEINKLNTEIPSLEKSAERFASKRKERDALNQERERLRAGNEKLRLDLNNKKVEHINKRREADQIQPQFDRNVVLSNYLLRGYAEKVITATNDEQFSLAALNILEANSRKAPGASIDQQPAYSALKTRISNYREAASFIIAANAIFSSPYQANRAQQLLLQYSGIMNTQGFNDEQKRTLSFYLKQLSTYCQTLNKIAGDIVQCDRLVKSNKRKEAIQKLTDLALSYDPDIFIYISTELNKLADYVDKTTNPNLMEESKKTTLNCQ